MSHVHKQQGFTIVELMLAMTFVSLLLMAIAMTVIQISNIYTKGLTMRAVNQSGQAITQDIRRSIEAARPLDIGGADASGGQNYQPMVRLGGELSQPDGGRLCTGSYSYIWNNGKAFSTPVNKFQDDSTLIRLVKVVDNGSRYCADPSRPIDRATAVEMLSDGDRELAMQSFAIRQATDNPEFGQALYLITLQLGTNDQEALDLTSLDASCKPPSENAELQDYCAVNKFEFTARAGNIGGLR